MGTFARQFGAARFELVFLPLATARGLAAVPGLRAHLPVRRQHRRRTVRARARVSGKAPLFGPVVFLQCRVRHLRWPHAGRAHALVEERPPRPRALRGSPGLVRLLAFVREAARPTLRALGVVNRVPRARIFACAAALTISATLGNESWPELTRH